MSTSINIGNYSFLGERFLLGPHPGFFIASACLLIFPVLIFAFQDGSILWRNGVYFPVILQILFFTISVISLVFTAFVDPGICLPYIHADPTPDDFRSDFMIETVNGIPLRRKWCEPCKHYRPIRARHCREVNLCVKRFCHFCPWTNNAIGVRNHRQFVLFILSTCLLCWTTFVLVFVVAALENKDKSVEGFISQLFESVHRYLFVVYSITLAATLTQLSYHQLSLIAKNMTSVEEYKQDFTEGNPFSGTRKENWKSFWLHPIPDSELQYRSGVTADSSTELGRTRPGE